jgi:cyclopropane-fatty-acyl-phospholipid synthase
MFEHVGRAYPEYFPRVHGLMKPGGLFLNHSIAVHPQAEPRLRDSPRRWAFQRLIEGSGQFRQRYVFPDGRLIPLSEANLMAERAGLEVRDVENLREHYSLTLRHWISRLESSRAEAVRMVGESVYRIWRLYLAASASYFDTGAISINQTLFTRPLPGHRNLPLSRVDLYA